MLLMLRVLQTGQFERVGSSETITVDVRVLSATNADLRQAIRQDNFREDLYYRLNVVELNLLPLCQRIDDILILTKHFIGDDYQLSPCAEQYLLQHNWPGNVRELENSCQRAMVFSSSKKLNAQDFGAPQLSQSQNTMTNEPLKIDEGSYIQQVLDDNDWTISRAASELNLSRQALYRRIEKYQLHPKSSQSEQ